MYLLVPATASQPAVLSKVDSIWCVDCSAHSILSRCATLTQFRLSAIFIENILLHFIYSHAIIILAVVVVIAIIIVAVALQHSRNMMNNQMRIVCIVFKCK